ncbi:MAG: molybdate ABC transporter permease subunit [Fimbriimonadaceae bacterium]
MKHRWSAVLALPFLLFLLTPMAALVVSTPVKALLAALHRPETAEALGVSARTTAVSIVVLVLLGTPLAWLVGRSRTRTTSAIETLIELPAVLPPSVAGIALLVAFGHAGLIGRHLPFEIPFTALAVILAQLFVASPFFLRPTAESFRTLDTDTIDAARLDGAGHFALGRHIVWPAIRPAYLSALCLAWARALGEFGATLLFAGSFEGTTQTAPLAIYDAFESDLDAAKALGVLLLVVAFVVLAMAKIAGRTLRR